jgi:hypothetical protein
LRENAGALATLRDKLSILWGGLEEKKTAQLRALPKSTNCQPAAESLPPPGKGKKKRKKRQKNKGNKKPKVEHTDSKSERGDLLNSDLEDDDEEKEKLNTKAEFFKAAVMEFGYEKEDGTIERKWKLFGTTIHT